MSTVLVAAGGREAAPAALPGWPAATVVLHERARRHQWSGAGPLSVKAFFNGRVHYQSLGARYAVDEGRYLVLNERQPYSITLDSPARVESFCVFFQPGLAQDVLRSQTSLDRRLLDDPWAPGEPVHFFERTYPHDAVLTPALLGLRRRMGERRGGAGDSGGLVEALHDLLARLLRVHRLARREAESLAALRPSTRLELYRRLHRARDFIAACFDQALDLEAIARVACLSPAHFLRSFKALFRTTPHQFLTDCRVEAAARLLAGGSSVTAACLAVGFTSPTSFSALFARRTGRSPRAWRRR